jgi:hypothetical protein
MSIGAVAIAQDSTSSVSELPSLESAAPNSSEDAGTTSDVVMKGFIPDLQRAQMVQDALEAAKKSVQKKAAAAEAAKTQAALRTDKSQVKAEVVPAEKKQESADEKARKAKEAADRANGIVPGKATASSTTKKATTPATKV